MKYRFLALSATLAMSGAHAAPAKDPYLWLENIQGAKALQWVKQQNSQTSDAISALPDFAPIKKDLLTILDSSERIPGISKIGDRFYNFWRDKQHPRGVWRSTTLEEYRKPNPAWETVLDLDALAKDEKENWVWSGADCVKPQQDRCLISLSRGGGDATVVREFDLASKSFVKDGFTLPEAKSSTNWKDRDTLYVATDFGKGTLTDSGYPRIVKEWKRNQPLTAAATVLEGKSSDISVGASRTITSGKTYDVAYRAVGFFESQTLLLDGKEWKKLDKPDFVDADFFGEWLLLKPKKDWAVAGKTWKSGAYLAINLNDFKAGKREFTPLFEPSATTSLEGSSATRDTLLLNVLDNVTSRLVEWKVVDGKWQSRKVNTPTFGSIYASPVDADSSNDYFYTFTDFLTPTTLSLASAGSDTRETLKKQPSFFDASPYQIKQHFAVSKDGTKVPYFLIARKDIKLDGKNPTLLYGYGGFDVSLTPFYSGSMGKAWLERGGVYALANIRGGGEYGPSWHEAARKQNRHKAFEDFSSIARDIEAQGIATPRHLGIKGGSNGGLLMGVMLTRYPQLFNAIVCQVPLLDMKRFNKLLAGASWMDEYGNPDKPQEWAYIKQYSPYHNIKKNVKYPATLFMTSTLDDRVHPGHARKMFAAMKSIGADVKYYERTEGGHGAAANHEDEARVAALEYTFLLNKLR